MDREVKEQYQVLIQAKDMGGQLGGLAGTATINITLSDVNDNPPRFSKSKTSLHCFHVYTPRQQTMIVFMEDVERLLLSMAQHGTLVK